ncbi:hypothetical protein [Tenacibaculum sp. M341]|uniref:hypothetical protein n=1 Tax=Tenacibaculum sp. M341 TaxID=2530339 RepID=UPI001045E853|nr:hypothetical protein [Tenacibaculum sp. M341]TCI91338.1 hypothetical protein EYW44_10300 [Tenacibaculum sp. M341]
MKKDFHYNPFSGVFHEDIQKAILPNFNIDTVVSKIESSNALSVEFIGKQGRGKTSHLLYLQQILDKYPVFLLDDASKFSEIMEHESEIVFVDSIHHLNFKKRIQLFKHKKIVIYTTHWSRKLESMIAKKNHYSLSFKGINSETLTAILNRRLTLATKSELTNNDLFSIQDSSDLIKKFGDNYRGIMNHLYEKYQ